MTDDLNRGDRVKWNTAQGETIGRVVKKLTGRTKINGHDVAASADKPEYLVRSDRSGKQAAHKPKALRRIAKGR